MTEQEFLKQRVPFWLEDETLRITIPSNSDYNDIHSHLSKKFGYNWLFAIRGYYWPGSHAMLYTGDYEIPNCTIYVAAYILNYWPDIKYVGFGCEKGKPGDLWKPKLVVSREIIA